MRVAFLTLGCKVNSYETEKMKINFEKKGHMVVAFEEKADEIGRASCRERV